MMAVVDAKEIMGMVDLIKPIANPKFNLNPKMITHA